MLTERCVPRHIIESRIKRLKDAMNKVGAKSLLVTEAENVQYLSGFDVMGNPPKAAWLLLVEGLEGAYLLVPPLEYYEALDEAIAVEVVSLNCGKKLVEALVDFLEKVNARTPIYVEGSEVEGGIVCALKRKFEVRGEPFLRSEISKLRAKKDEYEIRCVREAVEKTLKGLEAAEEALREGVRETSIAGEVEKALREEGVEAMAFDVLVASGPRSSYPHAKPTTRRVKNGEGVVVDVGVRVQGYCSDVTRTFIVGRNPEVEGVLAHVVEAQEEATLNIKEGVKASMLDARAREVLKERELDEFFLHGLGHGLGLSVHERPSISILSEDILEEGNVITIEPGVYLRGRFGVRKEDVFVVTGQGYKKLS
ncbi:MAG: Xaa-Pro peptidase family protein [Candidatus Nezhaarchaeota archaeon]|nr:Xaa-Pro peptidase family protein [Candidatus Nezhaarchaeota archaeon]